MLLPGGVAEVIKEMRRKQEEDGREEPATTEGCPEIDTKDTEKIRIPMF